MRVVIDARPALDPRKTGVGHYASQLVRHLPGADPESEYVAWYLHAKGLLKRRRFFPGIEGLREEASRFPARVFEPIASRLGVPRLEWLTGEFDALLATNFLPPATHGRGVVMVVHDLAFRLFPETAPQVDTRWLRRFERWLRECAAIIVPSEAAKADLVGLERVAPERVQVVHHGIDAESLCSTSPEAIEQVRRRFGLGEAPYVLFVGGIEPRKNLEALLGAFASLQLTPDVRLVIAGGPVRWIPSFAELLRGKVGALVSGVRERVVMTGYVSDAERVALLNGATMLAYPSLYEGFGFPVLEAMAARVPVLTSNVSSLPEVAGEAALLVDPHDEAAIADGLQTVLSDDDLRDHMSAAGLARAATFTWEASARSTAEVLRKASGRAG